MTIWKRAALAGMLTTIFVFQLGPRGEPLDFILTAFFILYCLGFVGMPE
jgi:hypothetical protein